MFLSFRAGFSWTLKLRIGRFASVTVVALHVGIEPTHASVYVDHLLVEDSNVDVDLNVLVFDCLMDFET